MNIYFIFVPVALLIAANLYFGTIQLKWYQNGKMNTNRRFHLKMINEVISGEKKAAERRKLDALKRLYICYLVVFYATILMAVIAILINRK